MTQATAASRQTKLSLPAILAFAGSSLPVAGLAVAISVQLPRFFASHLGVSLAVVGAAFGTVRAIDIWLDPMLGLAMDRTRTRWGRYRVWMIAGAPILMGALYMLFNAPQGATTVYLIVWLLIMYLGLSIITLSHSAWAAVLATSYQERSRIFGILAAVGVAGSLVSLAIPIVWNKMGRTDAQGVQAMGWFIIALIPVAVLMVVARTPERITRDADGGHFKLKDYASLFTRPNVLRILAADLCVTLGPGWMAALYLFFFKDSRGFTTTQANLLLMIYILTGFVGAPATAWLANKVSKHRALQLTTTLYSLGLITLMLVPKGNFLAAAPTMAFEGALAAGFGVMIRAITADIGDEIRLEGGKEQIGLLYALTNATSKVAGAFSIFLTFTVLARVGYDAKEGAVNSAAQIHGLELAYLIGPVVFVMIGGASFFGYKLGAERHAEIRRQLEDRDALYDEAPVIETLTAEGAATLSKSN
ncbi:MAG TPA: MFS transporter [Phenylobacterium sp.]|nr:MFS transporter [Phenylobacterium sp.]